MSHSIMLNSCGKSRCLGALTVSPVIQCTVLSVKILLRITRTPAFTRRSTRKSPTVSLCFFSKHFQSLAITMSCTSFGCCTDCIQTCIWGQVYNKLARCVLNASDLGPFILMEVHPGQSCSFPGLDQGTCFFSTTKPSPNPTPQHSSSGYVLPLIIIAIAALLFIFGLVAYKLFKRSVPATFHRSTGDPVARQDNIYESLNVVVNNPGNSEDDVVQFEVSGGIPVVDGYSLVDLATPTGSPRRLPTPPIEDSIVVSEFNTPNTSVDPNNV